MKKIYAVGQDHKFSIEKQKIYVLCFIIIEKIY